MLIYVTLNAHLADHIYNMLEFRIFGLPECSLGFFFLFDYKYLFVYLTSACLVKC